MSEEIVIKKIHPDQFIPFGATNTELVSYALDEIGILGEETEINGILGRVLVEQFYEKRNKFRQSTRLGHILMSEYLITKNQLIQALAYHVEHEIPLGEALVRLNICTKEQIENALKKQNQLRNIDKKTQT